MELLDDLLHRHDGVGEIEAVFQPDILGEFHRQVRVFRVLVGCDHAVQICLQHIPLGGHRHQLAVHVNAGGVLDLVAGAFQNGGRHLVFVHHFLAHRDLVGGLHGPAFPVGARVVDTLSHLFLGGVEHLLGLHIAHHAAVHFHRQNIVVFQHGMYRIAEHRQRRHRQHVCRRPAQKRKIFVYAQGKVAQALPGRVGCACLLFLLHPGADVLRAVCHAGERCGQVLHAGFQRVPCQPRSQAP